MKRHIILLIALGFAVLQAGAFELPSAQEYFCRISDDSTALLKTEYRSGKSDTLLQFSAMRVNPLDKAAKFEVSPDGARILLTRSCGDNYVYRLESNRCDKLSDNGAQHFPVFSPDGKKIAFVRDGDVYIKRLEYNTEIRVTEDGAKGVCNGLWSKENAEAFGKPGIMAFSPDGMYLLFSKDNGLWLYSIQYKWTKQINPGNGDVHYMLSAVWQQDGERFFVGCLDKTQTKYNLLRVNAASLVSTTIYNYKSDLFVSAKAATFLKIVSAKADLLIMTDNGGVRQIDRLNAAGKVLNTVSDKSYDVTDFYEVVGQKAYYQCAMSGTWAKALYSAPLSGGKAEALVADSAVNSAVFAGSEKYFILNKRFSCGGQQTISVNLSAKKQGSLAQKPGSNTRKMLDIDGYSVAVQPAEGESRGIVILATAYDKMCGWEQSLSQAGFTVAKVCGLGYEDANRAALMKAVYTKPAEVYNRVAAALVAQGYAAEGEVAIIGKGLSAGAAIMALSDEANAIDKAVAIAPVSDLRNYNPVLVERLMLTEGATSAYRDNSPIDNVSKIQKPLLIIHAQNDNEVPLSETYDYINALVSADKQFEMQIYPAKTQDYTDNPESKHLFQKIEDFLKH